MSGELNEQASQTASGLFFITHTVHSTVGITLMAAIVQMMAGDGQAGVEGSADDAGGEGAAEVEEHEVAGKDAAPHLIGRHLQEQLG